jgi:HDOD domain
LHNDLEVFAFTYEPRATEHGWRRDSHCYLFSEHTQTGQDMFNRSARAAVLSSHALPLRQAALTQFRARLKTLPLPPDSLPDFIAALGQGTAVVAASAEHWNPIADLRRGLFHAPGREAESQNLWREALATSVFASELAREQGAAIATAACGGLLHRVGEAFALKAMALAESEQGVRIDAPSKSELCSLHGRDIAERLVREWSLPPAIGLCVLGWRRFGEFASVSPEAGAVYVGHVLSGEMLHPYLTASGALEGAGSELGMCTTAIARVRARTAEVRELVDRLST